MNETINFGKHFRKICARWDLGPLSVMRSVVKAGRLQMHQLDSLLDELRICIRAASAQTTDHAFELQEAYDRVLNAYYTRGV